MPAAGAPKFRRRKAERPGEIVEAALAVFAEKGFAAARLDEIATRAGVSKGALYLYFETKEDLFRAVVEQAIAPNVQVVRAMMAAHPGPIEDLLRIVPERIAVIAAALPVGGVIKMVIGEARNFPELARVWHDRLVAHALGALTDAIAAAQGRGEVKAGDPRTYALQLISPVLISARQHVETMLCGMLAKEPRP